MTAPLDQAKAIDVPRWGVWNQHTREWVVPPVHFRERDAWTALLSVDSLHPWELIVQAEREQKPGVPMAQCPECYGSGECDSCGRECLRCDGSGEMEWDHLAKFEQDRQKRLGIAPQGVSS